MLRAANRTGLHGTVFFFTVQRPRKGKRRTGYLFFLWSLKGLVRLGAAAWFFPICVDVSAYPVSVFKNISKCMYMYVRFRCSVPKIAHRPRWPVILTLRASSRVPLQSTNESESIRSLPYWHVKLDASKIHECWEHYRTKTIDTSRGKGKYILNVSFSFLSNSAVLNKHWPNGRSTDLLFVLGVVVVVVAVTEAKGMREWGCYINSKRADTSSNLLRLTVVTDQ